MCAGQKFLLGQQPIVVLDKLIKMIKVPEKRITAVDCIFFVITSLFRNYDQTEFDISKDLMLEKIRMEIFHTLRKGTHKECLPALIDLVFLICIFDIKYAFPNFILPMVSPDSSVELQLIGLQTFNQIADSTHLTFDKTYAYVKRPNNSVHDNYRRSVHTNFRLEEFGSSSLNLQESMLESFRMALGKVLQNVDHLIGNFYQRSKMDNYNSSSSSSIFSSNHHHHSISAAATTLIPGVQSSSIKQQDAKNNYLLEILRVGILSVSRIPPNGYSTKELIQFLINKSFHIDLRIASEAKSLLLSLIRTRPVLRSTIVEEAGKLLLLIPEENTHLIRLVAAFLIDILVTWYDPLALNAREVDHDFIDSDVYNRSLFSASLLEGISLVLLCNPSVHVRNVAFNILHEITILNKVLPSHNAERGIRVLQVFEKYEKEVLRIHYEAYGSSACHYSSIEEIIVGCSEGDQEEWARCLGSLILFSRQENVRAIYVAFSLICTRMESLTNLFFSTSKQQQSQSQSQAQQVQQLQSQQSQLQTQSSINNITLSSVAATNHNQSLKKDLSTGKDEAVDDLILWRNFLVLSTAVAQGESSIFVSEFGYDSSMDISWIIDLIIPGLFIGSERVRDALQLAFRYTKDSIAFTLPNLIYLHLEGQKKKEITNQNRDIVRIETSRLYGNIIEQYLYSPIINRPLETRALNFISVSYQHLFFYHHI